MTTTIARAVCAAVALGALALASSGCLLLYAFNNDPVGLPCEAGTNRCLEGYACVQGLCEAAQALKAGDPCASSEQCDEELVCATEYAQCGADASDDVNCALLPETAEELRCRPACDIALQALCESGERCFEVTGVDGVNGFCQEATCATDSDCQGIPNSEGFCAGIIGPGRTGFCFEECDPLACDEDTGLCDDCNGLDNAPDEGFSCFPPPGELLSSRMVCLPHGGLPPFAPCGGPNDDICGFNSFCAAVSPTEAFCAPFCRFPDGAPACNGGTTCTQITPNSLFGYCAP